jgi:hypothetical protein
MKSLIFLFIGFKVFFLTGCSYFYIVLLTNSTTERVSLWVKPTPFFRISEKVQLQGTSSDGFNIYTLNPHDTIRVGEIEDVEKDIPFEALKIVRSKDTLSASNPKEIKKLYDKTFWGGYRTPYNITIQ